MKKNRKGKTNRSKLNVLTESEESSDAEVFKNIDLTQLGCYILLSNIPKIIKLKRLYLQNKPTTKQKGKSDQAKPGS